METDTAAEPARLPGRLVAAVRALRSRRRLWVAIQIVLVAGLLGFLSYAVRDAWADAAPRLRNADLVELGLACVVLAAYYLLFVFGWMRILAAWDIRISYRVAIQSEMVSMLAKYVPGGVWTPAARVVAVRRAGITDTPLVLASIGFEAGLSAVSGVLVFVVSLAFVDSVDAPLLPLLLFTAAVVVALHPRVFRPLAGRLLRPFGATEVRVLPLRTMLVLLAYYSFSWLVGGLAVFFMLRSVGGDPDPSSIPFLGGVSAVGAIVSVLAFFAPSGLGVREASMYGLMLAIVAEGVALGATVLNRIAITVVEVALLLGAALAWRLQRGTAPEPAESP